MAMPEHVRKAKEQSDKILKEVYGPDALVPHVETPPLETKPAETPPKEPAKPEPVTPAPVVEPEVKPVIDWEKRAIESEKKLEDERQRLSTLDGKYRHETQDLTNRLSDAMKEVAEVKISIAEANKNRIKETAHTEPPTFQPTAEENTMLSQARSEFPDIYPWVTLLLKQTKTDISSLIEGKIKEAVKNLGELGALGPKVEAIEKRVAISAEQTFYSELDGLVPEWRNIVKESAFGDFLKTEDELSGRPLYLFLTEAANSLDSHRTAKIYKAFQAKAGNGTVTTPVVTPVITTKTSQDDVAPPKPSGAGTPRVEGHVDTRSPQYTITRDFIKQFYTDKAMKRFDKYGGLERVMVIQSQIDSAVQSGRVEQ